ncbi:hypothetical protein DXC92_19010 [Clostridiales bacterium TF09-2AC]|nr:hypothetical protein DXC92_19010 [Clostridiales bacterium TF09-2AC]
MEKETKEVILDHIKDGTYVSDMMFDIQKLMSMADMELYAKPCCDRIEAAGLVDRVHVMLIPPSPWKLQVDADGMEACRRILEAYLQPEYLDGMHDVIRGCRDWTISVNNMLYSLRKISSKDLKADLIDNFVYRVGEEDEQDITELFKAELESRKLPGRIRRLVKRISFVIRMLRMFPGPSRILMAFIKESWKSWNTAGIVPHVESNGKYTKALRRFTDAHGGTRQIDKLRGDDLARYIFLAVKSYGKENMAEVNHAKAYKSCLEIENRYQELKQAMDTIGRLTPMGLLRLYPVDKEYDGKKWGTKDYFYTMERLRRLPADKPIGDAQDVACLLWDYQNWDLRWLLLQWQNVIGDLYIYCNDHRPNDEFHSRLMKKEA